jgi:hypothetical protein
MGASPKTATDFKIVLSETRRREGGYFDLLASLLGIMDEILERTPC